MSSVPKPTRVRKILNILTAARETNRGTQPLVVNRHGIAGAVLQVINLIKFLISR